MKTLAQKLAEVVVAVKHPPQSGFNKFHKYKYSTRDDIFGAVRAELAQRGIVVVPSVEEVQYTDAHGAQTIGKEQSRICVRVRIVVTDGESTIESTWWGESHTKDDKGIQQAVTQAYRFWCTNTFMLLDGSDEQLHGETGTQHGGPPPQNVHRESAPPSNAGTEAKGQMAARMKALGYEIEDVKTLFAFIAMRDGSPNIDAVHPGKLALWAERMAGGGDDTIKAKIEEALQEMRAQEAA